MVRSSMGTFLCSMEVMIRISSYVGKVRWIGDLNNAIIMKRKRCCTHCWDSRIMLVFGRTS